jgi:chromosome segregation ATPase
MDDENKRITEMEQRLLGIIKAQAELIQSFMDSTKRRLDKHKDRLDSHAERMDKHREEIDGLQVSVEDLDANKQDYPNEQEERSRIAQEESDKIEAELLAEEKERNVKMALTDILDRLEELEAGLPDTDDGDGLIEQLALLQEKVAALEKAMRGRFYN